MKPGQFRTLLTLTSVFIAAVVLRAQPPATGGADAAAALKTSLQEGLAKIRQYEWIETTVIKLKGEEKARTQNRCYYGADGKVQKVPMEQAAPAKEPDQGGGRGRRGARLKNQIVENKKDEMKEYMQQAGALIKEYVPPDPAKVQAAKEAGHLALAPRGGGVTRLTISQYVKPGDALTIDVDPSKGQLSGLGVNTYLEKPDEPVTLAVQMATLPDGALYAAQTTLDAKAKNITVVIQNSGHRKVGQ